MYCTDMYGERDYQVYRKERKLLHKKQDLFGISTWHHGKRSIPMKPFNILCLLPLNSLALISSETYNLQRVFRPGGGGGVVPYIGYIGMCRAKGYIFFLAVLV